MSDSCEIVIDQNIPLSFEGFLFNELEQLRRQPASEFHTFYIRKGKSAIARYTIFIHENIAKSPARAPFGSIEFDSNVNFSMLKELLSTVHEFCQNKNLKQLFIISYPQCYNKINSELLHQVLLANGYTIKVKDLNFHLDIDGLFENNLHLSEKRRLKKCLTMNFTLKLLTVEELDHAFALIKHTRERKGFPLSMSQEDFKKLFIEFPDRYMCFSIWDGINLIAVATGVKVRSDILYYFLPADHHEYKSYSPTVLLIKYMYDFCRENNYKLLDLGIATADGVANTGLIRFKENLGGIPSGKYSYLKIF